jgi:hypothetical protein
MKSFIFRFNVIDNSYRQVLTPVNNYQFLSRLEILDKFRPVTFHSMATQVKLQYKTGLYWFRRNESSHDLDSYCAILKMSITKQMLFLQQH